MSTRSGRRQSNAHPKRNRRKLNWFRIILNCLILAFVGELVFLSLTSPRLRIARIEVRGTKRISVADVKDRAGSAMGANIILADTRAVRRSVLRNPVALSAKVYRFPLNKLIIRVREREPFAILVAGGGRHLIDETGFVFGDAKSAPNGISVVEIQGPGAVRIGSKPFPKLIASSFECLQQSQKNNFRITKICVDPSHNMCLNMESGLCVRLGKPMDLDGKFKVLKKVLARRPDIATQGLYVDVTCVTAPSWKAKAVSPTL